MHGRVVCKHSVSDDRNKHSAKCLLGLFNGSPKIADCMSCSSYVGKVRGLGDIVAKATKTVGIKPCGPCKKRQRLLNKIAPMPCRGCQKNK